MTESFKLENPIALFPLPSAVFYPGTYLPLHVFELRYRKMVKDTLNNDSLIGMVLLQPGWEANYYGRPEVSPIGCVGRIAKSEQLPDGKFNILLEGLSRFRILEESDGKPYRLVEVEFLESTHDHSLKVDCAEAVRQLISRYEELIDVLPKKKEAAPRPRFPDCGTVGQVVDQIAYSLDWNPQRKQAFLEELDVRIRIMLISREIDLKAQILRLSTIQKQEKTDIWLN